MKYFNPTYWFKLWLLSAPLFNSENQGIYAKSIDNQNIKDWASKNTTNISFLENQELNLSNNQTSLLNLPLWNTNLTTHNEHHKHRHQKSRRIKKQVTPNPRPSKKIFKLNEKLIINNNNPGEYRNSFQQILQELTNNNILNIVFDDSNNRNWGENSRIFTLNTENYGYFRMPVQIRWQQDRQSLQRNLELVLRTDNLYLQGFIVTERGSHIGEISTYYHFDFREIYEGRNYIDRQANELTIYQRNLLQRWNRQPLAIRDDSVPLLTQIQGTTSRELNRISPDYRDMIGENDENIYWSNIWGSFFQLINRMDDNFNEQGILIEGALGNLARSLGDVILVTSEAMRFSDIYARIVTHLINPHDDDEQYITLGLNQNNEIYKILVSWGRNSRDSIFRWLLQIANTIQNTPNMMISPPSIVDFTRELNSPAVQVVLGYFEFQRIRNIGRNANCRRGKRELKNTYWHEKFCDLKPQIDKIKGKITAIKVLDENTQGGNLKAGDIYAGTDNGVYLIHGEKKVDRFDNLNFPIKDIVLDGNGSAYVINDKCEIYHLNLVGWGSEKLNNIQSCDLNKELKIYYNYNHENEVYHHQILFLTDSLKHNEIFTINLKSIHPVNNYKKMEFIGDVYSDKWGVKSAWGSWVSDGNKENYWPSNHYDLRYFMSSRNNNFHDIIKNKKFDEINIQNNNIEENFPMLLQKVNGANLLHTMWYESRQRAGLSWYRENNNYYLQFITYQYLNWQGSGASLDCWMKVGNGFRLYNDDTEAQISNSNDRKKRNIISNSTKWTNEFTKSINHEQHLAINNKTNFSTNNITSL
ncbi:hypothetical protein [Spiroplasma endosymbiont of Colias croceus]|uniref:hypothetical protein n=1 Tax=Spiroplasma endosymbiont of Colias croceus TaxID=3066310 RepID=UPI0030CB0977